MKKVHAVVLLFVHLCAYSCPTGRITQDSPPFFSDDFYKPTTESMDDLYEQVVKGSSTPEPGHDMMLTTTHSDQKEKS
jgi:hypothetical protein